MKFEHTKVYNFQGALRGLRNPLESWEKSDSEFGIGNIYQNIDFDVAYKYCEKDGLCVENIRELSEKEQDLFDEKWDEYAEWLRQNGIFQWDFLYENFEYAFIGPNDLNLAQRMIKAGVSDSKFLRQIFVSVDITAPLYWWKEADTYKIATVANSTSTMHKLSSTPITFNCFEMNDFNSTTILYPGNEVQEDFTIQDMMFSIVTHCESLRKKYLETKDKKYWKELIRILPESWLQTRTWTANYAVLRNIYFQRQNHKLQEWHSFCEWVESLPYSSELITYN